MNHCKLKCQIFVIKCNILWCKRIWCDSTVFQFDLLRVCNVLGINEVISNKTH